MNDALMLVLREWNAAYPRMDIYAKPGSLVMFDGRGGYDGEKEDARAVLELRGVYEVESVNVGSCSSSVQLRGVKRRFNTVLFSQPPVSIPAGRSPEGAPPGGVPPGEFGGLSPKQAWWAGYRVGKGLPPDMPRSEAVAAEPGYDLIPENLPRWRWVDCTPHAGYFERRADGLWVKYEDLTLPATAGMPERLEERDAERLAVAGDQKQDHHEDHAASGLRGEDLQTAAPEEQGNYSQWEKAGHVAHFLERSAERLARLIAIASPLVVVRNEINILRRRISDLEAALPWTAAEIAALDIALAAHPAASASAQDGYRLPLSDARDLLALLDRHYGNNEGMDWHDEDAGAVADALNRYIDAAPNPAVAVSPALADEALLRDVLDENNEREQFETWCRSQGAEPTLWIPTQPHCGYENSRVNDYWIGWLGAFNALRAALPTPKEPK